MFPFNKGKFKKIPYSEAMVKYGTDKPDLRNPIEMVGLEDVFANTTFGAFKGRTVRGFALDCSQQPRSFFDDLTKFMLDNGAGGLAWVRVLEDGSLKGPIIKFISEEEQRLIEAQKTLNANLEEVVNDLDAKSLESIEREQINKEIQMLKAKAQEIKKSDSSANEQIEEINKQIENLIQNALKNYIEPKIN